MKGQPVKRNLAYPLAIGSDVPFEGRVKESAGLIQPCDRLLDVGCSSGWLAPLALAKGVQSYVGLDRVIVGRGEAAGVGFVEGSVFALPFEGSSFDAVTLFDVIEHLPKRSESRALREAYRVLQPAGRLYFSTPHASWFHTPLDPIWLAGHRHYRRGTIRRLLVETGFKVDRLFVAGGMAEGANHWRLLLYKYALHRPSPSIPFIHRLIESSHGRDRPFGMTVFAVASKP